VNLVYHSQHGLRRKEESGTDFKCHSGKSEAEVTNNRFTINIVLFNATTSSTV